MRREPVKKIGFVDYCLPFNDSVYSYVDHQLRLKCAATTLVGFLFRKVEERRGKLDTIEINRYKGSPKKKKSIGYPA